ncbi:MULTISPECIES: hypothetical protein [Prochlorococcus]|uniref:hypothetical protein n=1 Tax=Prochlorococcus TaxID=1218 RepID=UPI00056604AB|nr:MULTISPECIES: hypothetical protein [Prochlorococcus]
MAKWSKEIEDELTLFIKDWLKQQNKTQKDLKLILNANSERIPALIEVLKKDYLKGGISKLATRLCSIEKTWSNKNLIAPKGEVASDPFGQLDLLLEKLKEDCTN